MALPNIKVFASSLVRKYLKQDHVSLDLKITFLLILSRIKFRSLKVLLLR